MEHFIKHLKIDYIKLNNSNEFDVAQLFHTSGAMRLMKRQFFPQGEYSTPPFPNTPIPLLVGPIFFFIKG
jgi:hypothetical protein